MKGTLILSVNAADKLVSRGFSEELGVRVASDDGKIDIVGVPSANASKKVVSGERINGVNTGVQYGKRELIPLSDETEWLSEVYHFDKKLNLSEILYPGVTRHKTTFGGECIVFSGTPDMPFKYFTAFSMLNETRKGQLIEILSKKDLLPLYYPEDAELYLRGGRLSDGRLFAAAFNLSQDMLEELPLVVKGTVSEVEMLDENGKLSHVDFEIKDGVVTVKEAVLPLTPIVLVLTV